VSLEIIQKPSIRPSLESNSFYVPEDPAMDKALLPNSGAAISKQRWQPANPMKPTRL
jgi:hypothetical protein